MADDYTHILTELGKGSQLKVDLNTALAALVRAPESHLRPRLCLNGREGMRVIDQISRDPTSANTEFWMQSYVIHDGLDNLWLNIFFDVFIDRICWPTNYAGLSSRQTSYLIQRLPDESQRLVLEAVRAWYTKRFLPKMQKALATVTAQIEEGDLLAAGVQDNRVFDIHGSGRGHDNVHYTELRVVGGKVARKLLDGVTLFDHGGDGYRRADLFLEEGAGREIRSAKDIAEAVAELERRPAPAKK